MGNIKVTRRSKVLIYQYSAITLLACTGVAWNVHTVAGIVVFFYGSYINYRGYSLFKEFLREKWNKQ